MAKKTSAKKAAPAPSERTARPGGPLAKLAARKARPPAPVVDSDEGPPEVNADGVNVASAAHVIATHSAHRHTRAALGLPEPGE